ncbi:MAG: 2'-5' RNA ligase family protein, partial [Dermatophilaceae bacterium]
MHHVELLPDPATDAWLREQWAALAAAGLPSLANHRSASNRPHLTLTMTREWPGPDAEAAARATTGSLPLPTAVGGLLVLGSGPFVLARAVTVTEPLLALHRAVATGCGAPATEHARPGAWVPHLTLAVRMTAAEVGAALPLVAAGRHPRSGAAPAVTFV